MGCSGQWLSLEVFKNHVDVAPLGIWFIGSLGSAERMVGLDGLRNFSNLNNSMIPWLRHCSTNFLGAPA